MTYQSAFKKVIKELGEDKGLYIAWHANIAMAYVDVGGWEKSRDSYKKRHAIANKAATHFLNLLLTKPKKLRVLFGKEFVKDLIKFIKLAKIENKKGDQLKIKKETK